jgi:hypothetical protein
VILLLVLTAGVQTRAQVLINEVNTDGTDYAEIVNLSLTVVDITGWTITMADDPSATISFTFPATTTMSPGEIIFIGENAGTPATPAGVQRFTIGNINWAANSGGACALNDAADVGQDLIRFGNPTNLPTGSPLSPFTGSAPSGGGANTQDVFQRTSNIDTDADTDWAMSTSGSGTPGDYNPGQTPISVPGDVGQRNRPLSSLVLKGGLNLNGNEPENGENGPFFVTTNSLDITVSGTPGQPWILIGGPLNRNNAVFSPQGSLDIGIFGSTANYSDLFTVMDGLNPISFFDFLATTGADGTSHVEINIDNLPPGILTTLQALVYQPNAPFVGLTAAFEITIP